MGSALKFPLKFVSDPQILPPKILAKFRHDPKICVVCEFSWAVYSFVWICYNFFLICWDSSPIFVVCVSRSPNLFLFIFRNIARNFASKLEARSEPRLLNVEVLPPPSPSPELDDRYFWVKH